MLVGHIQDFGGPCFLRWSPKLFPSLVSESFKGRLRFVREYGLSCEVLDRDITIHKTEKGKGQERHGVNSWQRT